MNKIDAVDFSYLDSGPLLERYTTGPEKNRVSFYINGMKCGSCVRTIESMPEKVPGLLSMRVDLPKKIAHAEIDAMKTDFKTVATAIQSAGFEPIPLTVELNADRLLVQEDRRDLIRLAVAGACAGNIMSFAFATYFGAADPWKSLFGWLSFILYLPVVTYVAWPFYRGAFFALKVRRLSIDLPMAIASFCGFLFSTIELLRGRDDIYFDSLAGFLFLILLSRWVQRHMQRRLLQPHDILESLQLLRARRVDQDRWRWVPQDKLKTGDELLLEAGETLAADAALKSQSAYFSMAFLSGEAMPKTFHKGGLISAGAKLTNGNAHVTVLRTLDETAFGKLLQDTRQYSLGQNRAGQLSDTIAQWLLFIVLTAAALFLFLYWPISPEEAVRRSLALIILACPCAMAFGTPLAIASTIKRAERFGIIVRDGGVFEAAAKITTVFLDKTGTLTDTDLTLKAPAEPVSFAEQMIILALERKSVHPIAFAFRRSFGTGLYELPVHSYFETPGEGVAGIVAGVPYRLGRAKGPHSEMSCSFFRNEREVRTFHFETRTKPGARSTVSQLRELGLGLVLLSGDSQKSAEKLGKELGFDPATEIFGGLNPADKALRVKESPRSMMVGDGINDAPALMEASVGVAVMGGVEAAFKTAHVMLTEPSLNGIKKLVDISREAMNAIRLNLIVSLAYNTCAGTLALCGFINPYVAALLMPASSGLILLSTWLGARK